MNSGKTRSRKEEEKSRWHIYRHRYHTGNLCVVSHILVKILRIRNDGNRYRYRVDTIHIVPVLYSTVDGAGNCEVTTIPKSSQLVGP